MGLQNPLSTQRIKIVRGNIAKISSPGALRLPPRRVEFLSMDIVLKILAPVLEVLFFVGMAGSALVVAISAVEDIETIMERDKGTD